MLTWKLRGYCSWWIKHGSARENKIHNLEPGFLSSIFPEIYGRLYTIKGGSSWHASLIWLPAKGKAKDIYTCKYGQGHSYEYGQLTFLATYIWRVSRRRPNRLKTIYINKGIFYLAGLCKKIKRNHLMEFIHGDWRSTYNVHADWPTRRWNRLFWPKCQWYTGQ
jgi:hypothetical protein